MNVSVVTTAILCGLFALAVGGCNCQSPSGTITIDMIISESAETIDLPSVPIDLLPTSQNEYSNETMTITFSTSQADGCTLSAGDSGRMRHYFENGSFRAMANPLQIKFPPHASGSSAEDYQSLGSSPTTTSHPYDVGRTTGVLGFKQTVQPFDPLTGLGDPAGDYSDTVTIIVTPVIGL